MSSSYSFTSSSSSYSSTHRNGQTSGKSFKETSHTTPEGTTVHTTSHNLGERPVTQTHRFDAEGRELVGDSADNSSRRIQDASNEEADRANSGEAEDGDVKREGGA
ncbi:hypothetical protein BJ170DRAFT_233768 [Xylariales sp. AK1849]|nr:hypothetical protein BJ170DRAFT_233768 [Xylariales sp. AK1849]